MSIEQLDVLRTFTVHLTSQGYESNALGLVKEAFSFFEGKMKGKYEYAGKQKNSVKRNDEGLLAAGV
jgi:hypothetical protein